MNRKSFYLVPVGALFVMLVSATAQAAPFAYFSTYSGNVYVLDIATNTVVTTLTAGTGFDYASAVTPDGSRAYVPSYYGGNITVIDTVTNSTSTIANIGGGSTGMAFNPAGTLAYVANYAANTVSVLDTNPADTGYNTVVASIAVGAYPNGVAISPDGHRVYVANHNDDTVSVIDTNPADANYNTVISTINVGSIPVGLAVSPDGRKVYVPSSGGTIANNNAYLAIIAVDAAGAPAPTATFLTLENSPTAAAFDPAGRCAYVTNQSSSSVSVIDVASDSVVGSIGVGSGPIGIALTHDGRYAYVANRNDGTTSQIDTATAKVVATVTLDANKANADVAAVGKFVTPQNTDSVFANDFGVCGF